MSYLAFAILHVFFSHLHHHVTHPSFPHTPYPIPHTTGPPIDLDGIQSGKVDPQKIIQQSKKGKPLMIFVGVKEPPNEQYTERVSRLWMQSLLNAHIPVER